MLREGYLPSFRLRVCVGCSDKCIEGFGEPVAVVATCWRVYGQNLGGGVIDAFVGLYEVFRENGKEHGNCRSYIYIYIHIYIYLSLSLSLSLP